MPFFIIGLLVLIFGIYFIRQAIKQKDQEGVVGFTAIIIAAVILVIFFGLFFRVLLS